MADLGEVGIVAEYTIGLWSGSPPFFAPAPPALGLVREKITKELRNYGGVSGAVCGVITCPPPVGRERVSGYTVPVMGTTKLAGVDTSLDVTVCQGGIPILQTKSTPTLTLRNLPTGTYEILIHGDGTKRSEVWGPTAVTGPVQASLSGTLAAATEGEAYSSGLTVTGGQGTKTWDISGAALPTGLSFNTSTGLITGTPTQTGTFKITIGVTVLYDGFRTYKDVILVVS